MWMNHTLEDTCPSSRSPRCNAGIYYRFITKKTFKKPNLGESQMKTVVSSYSAVVVLKTIACCHILKHQLLIKNAKKTLLDLSSFVYTKDAISGNRFSPVTRS
jgi:hypothetical protein